jgi:chromate transporter
MDLFISLTVLALQGFGGVLAVVQRELVERKKWLTQEEFVEQWSVAQILPGPNVVNLGVMIGQRTFGPSGALIALAGLLTFPLLILLVLAALYSGVSEQPWVQSSLRGMNSVVAGLIIATALKMTSALSKNPIGIFWSAVFAILTFSAVALLQIPLLYVLLVLGGASCVFAYRKTVALDLARQRADEIKESV